MNRTVFLPPAPNTDYLSAIKTKLRQGSPIPNIPPEIVTEIKYEGYIAREQSAIAEIKRQEATALSPNMDYFAVSGLRKEAQIKLNTVHPINIGQASRISGVTPADITVLLINLRKNFSTKIDKR